jgi:hypothetical protein
MKVGILTFHSSYNFGANLQTLAIQETLQQRGCHPVVVDYRDPWRTEMYAARVSPAQAQTHEQFMEKYLHTSPRFDSQVQVREYCSDELDAILVGSDQVFRLLPRWAPKQILRRLRTGNASSSWTQMSDRLPVYWLPWPRNGSQSPARLSIAASTGTTPFPFVERSLRREARRCLRSFDYVSVRDEWTRLMVRWFSGGNVEPEMCPDPVFGLNGCFQVPAEEMPSMDVSKTIFVSTILNGAWLEGFRDLAHERGYTIGNLPDPHMTCAFDQSDFTIDLPLSPLAWYSLLSQAAGYVGGRYHGLVSCAANETPAVSLDVSNRPRVFKLSSRPYDLCRKAGAGSRYVPVNWFARPSPAAVMRRLMDESSQAAMNHYAERAMTRLSQVFDSILAHAGEWVGT